MKSSANSPLIEMSMMKPKELPEPELELDFSLVFENTIYTTEEIKQISRCNTPVSPKTS